jgi:hypothetical protein
MVAEWREHSTSGRGGDMTNTTENYFSEIEDRFRAARGSPTFMLSPLDWALMEAWKTGGIPLEAVMRGIDLAFERWRRRPAQARIRMVNSLAYCANAVTEEAQAMLNLAPIAGKNAEPPFSVDQVRAFIGRNAAAIRAVGYCDLAASLESLDLARLYVDLEQLERQLTAIEEELIARLRDAAPEETLSEARRALDRELKPYRGKMTPEQLGMLQKQFLDRRLLESAGLPRLSLFYL